MGDGAMGGQEEARCKTWSVPGMRPTGPSHKHRHSERRGGGGPIVPLHQRQRSNSNHWGGWVGGLPEVRIKPLPTSTDMPRKGQGWPSNIHTSDERRSSRCVDFPSNPVFFSPEICRALIPSFFLVVFLFRPSTLSKRGFHCASFLHNLGKMPGFILSAFCDFFPPGLKGIGFYFGTAPDFGTGILLEKGGVSPVGRLPGADRAARRPGAHRPARRFKCVRMDMLSPPKTPRAGGFGGVIKNPLGFTKLTIILTVC